MNPLKPVALELKLYWKSFLRSNFWIALVIGYLFLLVYGVYGFTLQSHFNLYPAKWDFYQALQMSAEYGVILYLGASVLISEEREFGSWDILKSMGRSKVAMVAGKIIWIQVFALFLLFLSILVMFFYLTLSGISVSSRLIPEIAYMLLGFWGVALLFNLQGLMVSAFFSKRITSAIVAVVFSVFLSALAGSIDGSSSLQNIQEPYTAGAFVNIPVLDKAGLLLDPYYYNGFVAQMNHLTSLNLSLGANSSVQLYVTYIFSYPGNGYVIAFLLSVIVCVALIVLVIKLKDEWRLFNA